MAVSVTTTCRDIDELAKVAQRAIRLFFQECHKNGISIFVTETYRSLERQKYLYAQGRTRPGQVVTWTLDSNHKNRLAWDIGASTLNGNTNIYNLTVLKKAGAIAGKLGIEWGGTWTKNLDYPHFQVSANWTIPKGYALEGKVSIPTRSNVPIVLVKEIGQLPRPELTIPEDTLEEDLKVNKVPLLRDCSSPTLKTFALETIRKAFANGAITDKKWLDAAEDGTLSMVDLQLLTLYIGPGTKVRDISIPTLKQTLRAELEQKVKDGHVTDPKWIEQFDRGTLPIVDLMGLLYHEKK